tara:strand:+ start:1177 stop:1509 length:333 start_codon:yes stop_codon:yes gene_type:complete
VDLELITALETLGIVPMLIYIWWTGNKHQEQLEERMERHRVEDRERHDAMVRGWQKQLEDLENRSDIRVEAVRERYDAVVDRYNNERDKLFQEIDRKLDDVIRFSGPRNG